MHKQVATHLHAIKNKAILYFSQLENIVQFILCLAIVFIPLQFNNNLLEPIVTLRFFYWSIVILLLVVVLIINKKASNTATVNFFFKSFVIIQIVFIVWQLISGFIGINYQTSLFEIGRTFVFLNIAYLCYYFQQKNKQFFLHLSIAITVCIILQCIVGLLQFKYGNAFNTPNPSNQVVGVFANRTIFGSFIALGFPFCLFICFQKNIGIKIFGIVAIALLFSCVLLSQTRGSIFSLLAGCIVALVLLLLLLKEKRKTILLTTLLSVAIVSISSYSFLQVNKKFKNEISSKFTVKEIIAKNDSNIKSSSSMQRLNMWKKAIAVWNDNKILGVGTGNWKVVVQNYGNTNIVWGDGLTVPDRTHNIYLEILAETGIIGFLIFISTWLLLGNLLKQIFKQTLSTQNKIIAVLCFSFFAIYSVDGMFSFSNRHTDFQVLFYISMGILCSTFQGKIFLFNFKKVGIISFSLLLFSFFAAKGSMYFLMKTNKIETYLVRGNIGLAMQEVKSFKPNIFANLSDEGRPFEVFSSIVYDRAGMFEKSISESRKIFKSNPNSFNGYINLGYMFYAKNMYDSAIVNFKKCLFLKPNFDLLKLNIARTYSKLNNCDSTLLYINKMSVSHYLDTEALKNNCLQQ